LDIHTLAFPAGEIRGQVGGAGYHAIASLDGQQAVPRSNSPATGQALFSTVGSSFIEYQLQTNAMSGTEAHVHIAPPGQVGSTAFALNGAPPTYSGVQMVSTDILQLLRQRLLYVDVHSQSIPLGEIRGQIGQNPSIYGFSTTAANGNVPHAMWFTTERPIIGYSFELLLVGGSPSANAFLLLSFGPAAIPLLQFGLGPSWLWVDPTIMVLFHVASDPAGLGRFRISIPPVEGLIGVSVYAQWIVEAPNTTPLGYITSDALKATIQTLRN
jgi:hypothetical protein